MKTQNETAWQIQFEKWQVFARNIERRAKAVTDSIHDRGWALAASVGIPHNLCCVHNASIDDDLKGWCFRNPHRLKVARQAVYLLDNWDASRLAQRIVRRAWDRKRREQKLPGCFDYAVDEVLS